MNLTYRFSAKEKAKRPQLSYVPFGFGPRNCIGMRFALLEAKVALLQLLKNYTFVRAPDTEVQTTCNSNDSKSLQGYLLLVFISACMLQVWVSEWVLLYID